MGQDNKSIPIIAEEIEVSTWSRNIDYKIHSHDHYLPLTVG